MRPIKLTFIALLSLAIAATAPGQQPIKVEIPATCGVKHLVFVDGVQLPQTFAVENTAKAAALTAKLNNPSAVVTVESTTVFRIELKGFPPTKPADPPKPPVEPEEPTDHKPPVDPPEPTEPPPSTGGEHAYFDELTHHPKHYMSHSMRSQDELDSMSTKRRGNPRVPNIVYDPKFDAALFQLDPSGSTPGMGSTDTQQKRPSLGRVGGVSSLMVTWQFRYDEGLLFRRPTDLGQHKSWNLYARAGGKSDHLYVAIKSLYNHRSGSPDDIAEIFFSSPNRTFTIPGKSNIDELGSERLGPREAQYFAKPDKWNQVWMFMDGEIREGNEIKLSTWIADEGREPVLILNELPYQAPESFTQFGFNFDTSQDVKDGQEINGYSRIWNRNFAVLAGLTTEEAHDIVDGIYWHENEIK